MIWKSANVINDWNNFRILLWKNWSVNSSAPRMHTFSLLSPLLFSLTLVVLRFETPAKNIPALEYQTVDLQQAWDSLIQELTQRYEKLRNIEGFTHSAYVPRLVVAYAPHNVEGYTKIIELAAKRLNNIELRAYRNCFTLRDSMILNSYLAGVCFNQSIPHMNTKKIHKVGTYFNRLHYTLVFPSELRLYKDTYVSSHWGTNKLFDPLDPNENRLELENDGGYPGYVREGFISLQNALSMSYIYLITNKTAETELPSITLRRFPYCQYIDDDLATTLKFYLALVILAGYIFPITQLMKHIVVEKEDNALSALTVIGVRKWLHYVAWFIYGVLFLTLSMALVLLLLTLHLNDGYAVLSRSSFSALFFFFTFYNMATMSFCLMVASFFERASPAVLTLALLWFLTYMPFFTAIYDENDELPWIVQYIFSNTVLGLALSAILDRENHHDGFGWYDIGYQRVASQTKTVGHYILILFLLTIVYSTIGILMDRFAVTDAIVKLFQHQQRKQFRSDTSGRIGSVRNTSIAEVEPNDKVCTVTVDNLSKTHAGEYIVKNVSLQLFEDSVTVLMGHNGAGKTCLLSMIAGLTEPTEGTVSLDSTVQGFSQQAVFGIYISEKMLFRYLTVAKQLELFCRLKGTPESEVEATIDDYLNDMHLEDKVTVRTCDLSRGLQQHLAVCCALVGNSKIVILDEPSSHMDFFGKQCFWRMLTAEKMGRTIFMSSHAQDEVHALADRLAIMSNGTLNYCGSTLLLRNLYDLNYRVIFTKDHSCNPEHVTELIRKYVPDIEPISNICNELSYSIAKAYLHIMAELIDELEEHSGELHITSFEISENTLNDMFCMLGAENPSEGDFERQSEILSGKSIYQREYTHLRFLDKEKTQRGFKLWLNHLSALTLKRLYYIRHFKALLFTQLLVPIMIAMLAMLSIQLHFDNTLLRPMNYLMKQYKSTITVADLNGATQSSAGIASRYRQYVNRVNEGHKFVKVPLNETFVDFMLSKLEQQTDAIKSGYLVGASFIGNDITAWFSNFGLHTVPLALNQVYTALIRDQLNDDYAKTVVTFHPLPFAHENRSKILDASMNVDNVLSINLVMILCLAWSFCCMLPVRERKSRFRLMQHIAGCHICMYWAMTCFYDFAKVVMTSVLVMCVLWLIGNKDFRHPEVTEIYFGMLLLTGFVVISYNYLLSTLSDDHLNVYIISITFSLYGSIAFLSNYFVIYKGFSHIIEEEIKSVWYFWIFPTFSLSNALVKIFKRGTNKVLCENRDIELMSRVYEQCQVFPSCCGEAKADWHWTTSVELDLLITLALAIVCWIVLFFTEYRIHLRASKCCWDTSFEEAMLTEYERLHRNGRFSGEGDDVAREVVNVLNLTYHQYMSRALVCNAMTKISTCETSIRNFCLVLKRSDCLSIPVVIDNGMEVLFKVLSGQVGTTNGNAYVYGNNLESHRAAAYRNMGYCPGRDPLIKEYTPDEVMHILCLLRGLPPAKIKNLCITLSKVLGFRKHLHQTIAICSNGIRRRLSCACAIINSPSLLLLDRPTAAIDPAGVRLLLYTIDQLRLKRKTTVLFSSLMPLECELFCTRLAMISNGYILRIGTPWDFSQLKKRNFVVYVKMKQLVYEKPLLAQNLVEFMSTHFKKVALKEQYRSVLIFVLPYTWNKVSEVFQQIQFNKFNLHIETFRIYQQTFSRTFFDIMQNRLVMEGT